MLTVMSVLKSGELSLVPALREFQPWFLFPSFQGGGTGETDKVTQA
jgi:hypothetical protein